MVAAVRPTYRAVAERSGSWWAVRVAELPGVYTQARRLDGVAAMTRDAVALMLDSAPDAFDVAVEPALGSDATDLVERVRASRIEAERAAEVAAELLRLAVERLLAAGLSIRDIGAILGLSHQRIAQVSGGRRTT